MLLYAGFHCGKKISQQQQQQQTNKQQQQQQNSVLSSKTHALRERRFLSAKCEIP